MESNVDAKPSKGMRILASLGNKDNHTKVKMLIDSGTSMSLLIKSMYKRLNIEARPLIQPCSVKFK